MVHIISMINLKGGVGKTTTTVALAETLSGKFGKKVLVIDLDPQTNATCMLIGEEQWSQLNKEQRTLARLFEDALKPTRTPIGFDDILQKSVSDVTSAHTIDLLPSSLSMSMVEYQLATNAPSASPFGILKKNIQNRLDDYDIVIIDCPPNLGMITLNGLHISHGYIIPTIADFLSTYSTSQIGNMIEKFSTYIFNSVQHIGIVVNKFRKINVHETTEHQLRHEWGDKMFKTVIPESSQIASAAEYYKNNPRTIGQKYDYKNARLYHDLTKEVLERLGD